MIRMMVNHTHGLYHRRGRSFAQNRRQSALLAERKRNKNETKHTDDKWKIRSEQEKLMKHLRLQDATQTKCKQCKKTNQEKEQKERQLQWT